MSYATETRGLRALARLVVLPLLGVAVGLGAAYVVTAEMTPTYRATASVVVLPKEQKKASSSDLTDVSLALNVSPSVARLAESREVANTVAKRLRVPEDDIFGKATAVSEPGNQIVTVQAEAESPVTAARIANEVTKATTGLYNQLQLSGKSGVTVQALDVAAPPAAPVSPRPLLNYALGALVGLLIGVGVATLRRRSDDRFRGVRELEKRLGLPTLGLLRSLPRWPRDVARLYRRRGIRASVDAMVTGVSVLAVDRHRGDPRACRVLVTSVGADRPTPVVAALLAQGLARQGHRAVVVDGQPRRHGVDAAAGGLTTSVESVLDPANDRAAVRVISSAALAEHLRGPLEPEAVAGLVDALAARTDALVITAPPVFSGRSLATLAAQVDVVLLVVDTDRVGQPEATRAALLVRRLGVAVAGTLVIGTAVERDGAQPAVWLPQRTQVGPRRVPAAARTEQVASTTASAPLEPAAVEPAAVEPAAVEPAAVEPAVETVSGPVAEQVPELVAPEPTPVVSITDDVPAPVAPLAKPLGNRRWLFAKPVGRHAAHGTVLPLNGVHHGPVGESNGSNGSNGANGAMDDADHRDAAATARLDDDTHVIPAATERARRSLPPTDSDIESDTDDTSATETCPPRRVRAWAS